MSGLLHTIEIQIPFETANQATVAQKTLLPDPILKKNELTVNYAVDECNLVCSFKGVSDRVIRVAVSNVLDNIKTIIECIEQFDGKQDSFFDV